MTRVRAAAVAIAAAFLLGACQGNSEAATNLKAAQGFLRLNAKQPGVVSLQSGLEYRIVSSGPTGGPHPGPGDEVKVNYEGKLLDGKVFDSSFQRGEPLDLPLDRVIPGWTEERLSRCARATSGSSTFRQSSATATRRQGRSRRTAC